MNPLIRQSPPDFVEVQNNGELKGQRVVTLLKENAGATGYVHDAVTIDGFAAADCVAPHRDDGIPHVGRMYGSRWAA